MFLIVVVLVCLNVCRHWLNVVDLAVGDAKKVRSVSCVSPGLSTLDVLLFLLFSTKPSMRNVQDCHPD